MARILKRSLWFIISIRIDINTAFEFLCLPYGTSHLFLTDKADVLLLSIFCDQNVTPIWLQVFNGIGTELLNLQHIKIFILTIIQCVCRMVVCGTRLAILLINIYISSVGLGTHNYYCTHGNVLTSSENVSSVPSSSTLCSSKYTSPL